MKGLGWAWGLVLLAEAAPQAGVEQRFRAYMDALNAHQVDKAMALLGPDLKLLREGRPVLRSRAQIRDIREWEIPLQARFEYTIYAVGGDRIAATVEETNLLYAALEVRRTMHAEYRFRDGQLIESHLRRIEERGRPWREALAELEGWLAGRPADQTVDLLINGRLAFTGAAGRKLAALLDLWRRQVEEARARNEPVLRSYLAAMNRHDVDAQYAHYAGDMVYVDGERRTHPDREAERPHREFEGGSVGVWSAAVLDAGLDSLELRMTEELDYYRALGVGPRHSRRSLRFRDGKIIEMRSSDWTQDGRPYEGARDLFKAWLLRERPEQARQVTRADRLVFNGATAALLTPLAREWRAADPCTLYHPLFSPREPRIAFSSNCEGQWRSGLRQEWILPAQSLKA